jgi:hypothetical protein
MQIQTTLIGLVSTAVLVLASGVAYADPDKDESRGKERREGRGFEHRGEHKYEYKDGERQFEHKDGKYEYKDHRGKYEHKDGEKRARREGGRTWFHDHGYSNLRIPNGHLPPPGECRIWYPGRPAGHQPPPGRCGALSRQVPAGAWLIRRPDADPQYVDVSVYDQRRPGVVLDVGIFDARTGAFVRIEGAR